MDNFLEKTFSHLTFYRQVLLTLETLELKNYYPRILQRDSLCPTHISLYNLIAKVTFSFHDPTQLPFMELMGSAESVHIGQFWPYDPLKTHGQALHLHHDPEKHQELFFKGSTILL